MCPSVHFHPPQSGEDFMSDHRLQWKAWATGPGSESLLMYCGGGGDLQRGDDDLLFLCVEELQSSPVSYRFYLGDHAAALDHGVFSWGPN